MRHRQALALTSAIARCCLALALAFPVPVRDSRAGETTAPGITVTPPDGDESWQASSGSTLTFVSSTAVTPTADFSNGDFVRIFQRGAKVLVTFSTDLASALIPGTCAKTEPQSGAYVYREFNEDMTPTGKQGVIACGVKGDNGGLLVGDRFYLALSGVDDPVLDGWNLSMYDSTTWSTLPAPPTSPLVGPTSHLLECGKGAGDPMLASVNGLVDIDGKYVGSGCCGSSQPSYCQPGPTCSFTTHHNFFDPATFSVAPCPPSCPLILPVPPNPGHIELTSVIVDDDTIDFLSSTSILGDLVLMRLDSDWHYLSSSVLRPHAWCPEGVASYGGHYFVSFVDSSNCSGTLNCQMNVRLAVFDREWTPVEEVAVTSFAQGSQMDVQKPTILLEGDKLYVAYLSGPFGVAGANQVSVTLFQLAAPQTSCSSFTIEPTSTSPTASAGSQTVTVTGSPSGCTGGDWTASTSASWLSVSAASGTGSGSVAVSWTQNTDSSSRTSTATIGGQSFTVTQAGGGTTHAVRRRLTRPGPSCPGPLAPLGVLRSTDHGATWVSLGNACMQGSAVHAVDPAGLVVDGKVVLFVVDFDHLNQSVPQTIYRTTSTDGVSFTTPAPVYAQPRTMVDPTVVRLADGSYRMYVTSDGEGIISATSADGLVFTREAGVRLGFGAGGMIGGLLLPDQRLRFFLNGTPVEGGPEGIFSMISTDGLVLAPESGFRITPSTGRQAVDACPVRLDDGSYLMSYEVFDDGMMDHPDPWTFTEIHLATSADGFDWTPTGGVIGHGGTQTLVEMPDGTLLIYFVNQ